MTRHVYRGEPWYVIRDPVSGRNWRFSAAAERIIRLMDGERTVDDIWVAAGHGAAAPSQDEILALLSQLHAADALSIDVAPDLAELLRRGNQSPVARMARADSPIRSPCARRCSTLTSS